MRKDDSWELLKEEVSEKFPDEPTIILDYIAVWDILAETLSGKPLSWIYSEYEINGRYLLNMLQEFLLLELEENLEVNLYAIYKNPLVDVEMFSIIVKELKLTNSAEDLFLACEELGRIKEKIDGYYKRS